MDSKNVRIRVVDGGLRVLSSHNDFGRFSNHATINDRIPLPLAVPVDVGDGGIRNGIVMNFDSWAVINDIRN